MLKSNREKRGRKLRRAKRFLIRTVLLIIKAPREVRRRKKRKRSLATKRRRRRVLTVFADLQGTMAEKQITILMTFLMQLMHLKELILKMLLL